MGVVLRLVSPAICHELVTLFRDLADAAERGDFNGAVVSCSIPGPDHDFALYVAGESRRNPTHSRGTLCQLDLELSKLMK